MANERPWNTAPATDINILLLGPTGVGKTTIVNAFANYLVYNSLDGAMAGELQAVIPAWFTILDKDTFEEKTIIIGKPDQSERKGKVGQSCTCECRSFVFPINNRKLRIIDAPGIGDTGGVLQDEKNFEDILAYIAQFEYLNGICILLKPNEQRLNVLFRFCVKELLRHLHVQAKENIMFVFTNARATSFEPGLTAPLLRKLLETLEDQTGNPVPFSRENTFLFDNEAFRFLALCKNGINFEEKQIEDYRRSWEKTIKEFTRLMSRINKCEQHNTRKTVSLNDAQQLIRKLSRPIGEIATLIEENIQLAEQHKQNVVANRAPTPLALSQMEVRVERLPHPRTVCTENKCTKVVMIDGQRKVDYASHCHPHCYLIGVEQETIGHEKLKQCAAIDEKTEHCMKCGCHWEKHMHITYELRKCMVNVPMGDGTKSRSPVDAIEKRIKDLRAEEEAIIKVCSQLTLFLRTNALNPVNDDILEYIQHFIREEEAKKDAGAQNEGVIAGLRKLLAGYKQEVEVVRRAMDQTGNQTSTLKPDDIFDLVATLYKLPINGSKIEAQVNELKHVQHKFNRKREHQVDLPMEADSSSVLRELREILT